MLDPLGVAVAVAVAVRVTVFTVAVAVELVGEEAGAPVVEPEPPHAASEATLSAARRTREMRISV